MKHTTPQRHKMHFISNIFRVIISLIFFSIAIIIGIINYYFSKQNYRHNLNYNMSAVTGIEQLLKEQKNNFMNYINGAYISYYAYRDGLFSYFNATNTDSTVYSQDIYRFLGESFALNSQIASMTIYNASDNKIYSVTKKGQKSYSASLPEFSALTDSYKSPYTQLQICPSTVSKLLNTSQSYSFIYCLRDVITYQNIGAIQIDYSNEEMNHFLSSNYPGVKGNFLVINEQKNILYDSTDYWYQSGFPQLDTILSSLDTSNNELLIDGKPYFFNAKTLSDSNITVIGLISKYSLQKDIRDTTFFVLAIIVILTLLTMTSIYFYINRTTKQLNNIYYSIMEVKHGNLDTRVPIIHSSNNEFKDISIAFNDMLENLQNHITKVYKTEIEASKYKLKVLQSQINPHFLYNTLEAIRMKAILNEDAEVDEMIYILSKIFRNSIKENSIISIRHEIENCKNYLRLCDIQYDNLFSYTFHIDNKLLSQPIIQHALIVIVENYIMHGFDSNRSDNCIRITGYIENNFAVFRVKDNGFGIKADELTIIKNSFTDKSLDNVERIGLKNIYKRAKLLYGDDSDLQINSIFGEGTEVIFTFILKEGDRIV